MPKLTFTSSSTLRYEKVTILSTLIFSFIFSNFTHDQNHNIATYNIFYYTPPEHKNSWELRKNHVANIIRFHNIVLWRSQEGEYNKLRDLTDMLGQKYVGVGSDGPIFFTHYSFMGFDPKSIEDRYTNSFNNNRTIALINQSYCMDNSLNHKGYSEKGWGLTASDGPWTYQPHEPSMHMDSGTLTPTGVISSFPYMPEESMKALKYFYRKLGDELRGISGFKDAINLDENWVAPLTRIFHTNIVGSCVTNCDITAYNNI